MWPEQRGFSVLRCPNDQLVWREIAPSARAPLTKIGRWFIGILFSIASGRRRQQ
jgi:hypothetical protein